MKFTYVPLLKTTDAELRAFSKVSAKARPHICPFFELTKGKTFNNPSSKAHDIEGDLSKSVKLLRKKFALDTPFILSLTTEKKFQNNQIANLLFNSKNGFSAWTGFLQELNMPNIIPSMVVDLSAPFEMIAQAQYLEEYYPRFVFRIQLNKSDLDDADGLARVFYEIAKRLKDSTKMLGVLDLRYVEPKSYDKVLAAAKTFFNTLKASGISKEHNFIVMSSSFPAVLKDEGLLSFSSLEFDLFKAISHEFSSDFILTYGDYAAIHPIRKDDGGGFWIPRVDYPTLNTMYYARIRHYEMRKVVDAVTGQEVIRRKKFKEAKEAYREASILIKTCPGFGDKDCWGTDQIIDCSLGNCKSNIPSFWISVRANIHMTMMANVLKLFEA